MTMTAVTPKPTALDGATCPEPSLPTAYRDTHPSPPRTERFKILEELGRGGMGLVYRAEQQTPVRRTVALKVIQPRRKSQLDNRFRAECHTLAQMRHPYIATMYEAGETEDGYPFFVMELVEGLSITAYCDQHRLTVRQRLALFAKVCEAIQHAHEHGIIHRDLKPSNILVTGPPEQPVPKLIDFGVAKHINDDRGLTRAGQVVGSPGHMSPEQMQGGARGIDTRSDVYALGNVLYELLTGTALFVSASGSVFDYLMQIAEQNVEAPSARCRSLGEEIDNVSHHRRTTRAALLRDLARELDWIVLRAIARERAERYPSAAALGADIGRFLDQRPVLAHPGGRGYALRKMVARHRPAVAAATLAVATMVVAGITIVASLQRARSSEREARAAAQQAQTVNRFLTDLLASADPAQEGRDARVLDLVQRQLATLDSDLSGEPLIEASIRHTLGKTYLALGLYDDARVQLNRAQDLHRTHAPSGAIETIETELVLVDLALRGEDLPLAETAARDLVDRIRAEHDGDAPLVLRARFLVASAAYLRGNYAETNEALQSLLENQERVHGRQHPETLETLLLLAKTHHRQGQLETAEALYRKVHEARTQRLGSEHPRTLESANLLANALFTEGRYADAEALYRETLARRRARLGLEHPETLSSLNNLANALYKQKRYEESEALHREVSDTQRRLLGDDHPDTLISMNNLGNSLRRHGRLPEAEAVYHDTMSRQRQVLGPSHDETVRTTLNLVKVLQAAGRQREASDLVEEGRATRPELPDFEDWRWRLARDRGDWRTALEAIRRVAVLQPKQVDARAEEGRLLLLLGQPDDAREAYRRALALVPGDESLTRDVIDPLAKTLDAHPNLAGAADILRWLGEGPG